MAEPKWAYISFLVSLIFLGLCCATGQSGRTFGFGSTGQGSGFRSVGVGPCDPDYGVDVATSPGYSSGGGNDGYGQRKGSGFSSDEKPDGADYDCNFLGHPNNGCIGIECCSKLNLSPTSEKGINGDDAGNKHNGPL